MYNQSGSRRWTHFRSALQLAIQRSAHKWTFEDFAQCFPMYIEEGKNGASTTFDSIADYIESQNINDLEKLFKDYAVQENIDILHRVINEAKDRNAKGESSKDVWREDLEPRAAVSARTIPILESEVKRLREALTETQKMNNSLQSQIEENVAAAANGKQSANRLLDKLDQVHADWRNLLTEEVEAWTLQALESLKVGV